MDKTCERAKKIITAHQPLFEQLDVGFATLKNTLRTIKFGNSKIHSKKKDELN